MYIYKFEDIVIEWTDGNITTLSIDVVAKSYSQAILKMEKHVLSPSNGYTDDGRTKVLPKKVENFQSMARGDYVDC